MLTKAALALVAAAATLGPCDPSRITVHKDPGHLWAGLWGGENAALIVDDTSAHVHIGCTYGNISGPILIGGSKFDVAGLQNITAHPVDRGVFHPARFVGKIIGDTIRLTITLTDTTVTLGPVTLVYNKEPKMGPCPICRRNVPMGEP